MKIILKKSEWLDDWFTIERAEHDGRDWMESTGPNSMRLMSSERLSPEACIEGSAFEMRAVAKAIKDRGAVSFKRCAVRVSGDAAYFCSPKNSEGETEVPLAEADAFAEQAMTLLEGAQP